MESSNIRLEGGTTFTGYTSSNSARAELPEVDRPAPPISRAIERLQSVIAERLAKDIDVLSVRLAPALFPGPLDVAAKEIGADQRALSPLADALNQLAEVVGNHCTTLEHLVERLEV